MLFIRNFHNLPDFLNDFLGENVVDKFLRGHFIGSLFFFLPIRRPHDEGDSKIPETGNKPC